MAFGIATLSLDGAAPFAAVVREDRALPLTDLGIEGDVLSLLDRWETVLPELEAVLAQAPAGRLLAEHAIHAPYFPRQAFCCGANYKKHVLGLMADEAMRHPEHAALSEQERLARVEKQLEGRAKNGLPYMFVKLPSCVIGAQDEVVLPRNVEKPDWELELGVVIGKRARHVAVEDAMAHVAGFAIVNDLTARELVFRREGAIGADWLSGKCFPTFLPFGPMIVPRQFVADPYDLNIKLSVNGRVFQDETTADMLIGVEKQVAYLSSRLELLPGDVICTGSPYGNGSAFGVWLKPGDVMVGEITGLGVQRNLCVAEG